MKVREIDRTGARATGKTYRTLLKALLLASEGQDITVVAREQKYADCLYHRALDASATLVSMELDQYKNVISFPSGGCVKFISEYVLKREFRGSRSHFMFDNSVTDWYEKTQLQVSAFNLSRQIIGRGIEAMHRMGEAARKVSDSIRESWTRLHMGEPFVKVLSPEESARVMKFED